MFRSEGRNLSKPPSTTAAEMAMIFPAELYAAILPKSRVKIWVTMSSESIDQVACGSNMAH